MLTGRQPREGDCIRQGMEDAPIRCLGLCIGVIPRISAAGISTGGMNSKIIAPSTPRNPRRNKSESDKTDKMKTEIESMG